MDAITIEALSRLSDNGLWAVVWYSLFNNIADYIIVGGIVWAVRTLWRYKDVLKDL